jgi:hypothetical protein
VKSFLRSKVAFIAVAATILLFGVVLFIVSRHSPNVPGSLASLSMQPAPWQPDYTHLANRLAAINLPLLENQGIAEQSSVHLDIYIHSQHIPIPANIGAPSSGGFAPLHTTSNSGVITIESSNANAEFTLGQFFDIWGVKFNDSSIGEYSNNLTNHLIVYDNGAIISDPAHLVLSNNNEITITYGTASEQPLSIPSTYNFSAEQ